MAYLIPPLINTEATDSTHYVLFEDSTTGVMIPRTDSGLSYNPLRNTLTTGILISNVAIGTAPFTITSTTEVANLRSATATKLVTARTIALTGDTTGTSAAFDGTANLSFATTLASVGTAGTYRSVTTDAKGRVTAGTNPTTLSGYGITDAATSAQGTLATNAIPSSQKGVASGVALFDTLNTLTATDLPLYLKATRNTDWVGGGSLSWGVVANRFSWSAPFYLQSYGGKLLVGGVAITRITIAAGYATLTNAWDCAYITIPATDGATVTVSVGQYNAITGNDKLVLAVKDSDNCLELRGGLWLVNGETVAAGGKRDMYLPSNSDIALGAKHITSMGNLTMSGHTYMDNGKTINSKNIAGTNVVLLRLSSSSDKILVGGGTDNLVTLYCAANPIWYDGTTERPLLTSDPVDGSVVVPGNLTVSSVAPTLQVKSTGGDATLEFDRTSGGNWRLRDSSAVLHFESDWTTLKGAYYDAMLLYPDTGNLWVKGSATIGSGDIITGPAISSSLFSTTTTGTVSIGEVQTTGSVLIGGTAGTGAVSLGRSSDTQSVYLGGGGTASGKIKTINIGTGGVAGSTTTINIGASASDGNVNINQPLKAISVAIGDDADIGPIVTLGAITAGTGYTNGTYLKVLFSGGTGTGAYADITVTGGVVTSVTVVGEGCRFRAGEVITVSSSLIGGTGSGFSVPITTVRLAPINVFNSDPRIRLMSTSTSVAAGTELGSVLFGCIDGSVGGRGDKGRIIGVAENITGGCTLQLWTAVTGAEPSLCAAFSGNNQFRLYNSTGTFYHYITASATATRSLILPDANVTLVSGTMVPTTGTGATGTWDIGITGHASLDLPLTGGTLTGSLIIKNVGVHSTVVQNSSIAGEYLFGGSPTGSGIADYIRVGANKLQYYTSSTAYDIWHAGSTVPITNGGTGATATAQGGVVYGASTTAQGTTTAGSAGQVLTSNGTAAPTWGPASIASTTAPATPFVGQMWIDTN